MSWEAIGAIGQAVSALALVIVIVQVRHARRESRRALSQGRGEATRELYAQQCDERINRLHVKADVALGAQPNLFVSALMEQAGFTKEEATLMFWMQLQWWNYRVQLIPKLDELPPMERAAFDRGTRIALGRPGIYRLFHETIGSTDPVAVRYIENLLAQPG